MAPRVDETDFNNLWRRYQSAHGKGNSQISYVEAVTNFLQDFTISATMARQEGRVQLEQSDMPHALNMAKIANGGYSHAAISVGNGSG